MTPEQIKAMRRELAMMRDKASCLERSQSDMRTENQMLLDALLYIETLADDSNEVRAKCVEVRQRRDSWKK